MLSEDLINKIESNQITSRRQLYKITGRSKKLRNWLDQNNILNPVKWTKELLIDRLKTIYNQTNKIPLASDNFGLARAVQNHFGSWNLGLYAAIETLNQKRYDHLTDTDLLNIISDYVRKYRKIPLREEFNGEFYPDFSTYFSRFNTNKWSEIIGKVDLNSIKYFSTKEKYGVRIFFDGKVYLSNKEYLIGKWLTQNSILFDKEIPYGNSNHVFDFYIPSLDLYIEYYGIASKEYKENIIKKQNSYGNRKVLEIFKHDNLIDKLSKEVQRLQLLIANNGDKV